MTTAVCPTTNKLIFITVDALRAQTAYTMMGFLEHMTESRRCARYTVQSQLPAMSRPLYETLLTGVPPVESGIYNNYINRRSQNPSVFQLARDHKLTTAACAYHWISELYNKSPFDPTTDRFQLQSNESIQNGIFYFEDDYPDSHLFADAGFLLSTYAPDFLYLHPMNLDDVGHKYGGDSPKYAEKALRLDVLLSGCIPQWLHMGYQILLTADHGMSSIGFHNGRSPAETHVPLYLFTHKVPPDDHKDQIIDQLQLAPLACKLLDIPPSPLMVPLQLPPF